MAEDRRQLETLGRNELIERARALTIERPEVMTRVELVDEIVQRTTPHPEERRRARGWLGVARDLVASVVEQGLNLPDAAALIRGDVSFEPSGVPQRPVATVTLAEIYAAQGHTDMAAKTLGDVLAVEPDHEVARRLLDTLGVDAADADVTIRSAVEPAAAVPKKGLSPAAKRPPTAPAAKREPSDDAVVISSLGDGRAFVYWEIGPVTRARVADGARAGVRLVGFRPTPAGAERVERDLEVTGRVGSATIEGLADTVIRGALGVEEGGRFVPTAVAAEVSSDPASAAPRLVFSPRPRFSFEGVSKRAAPHLARA